ncbi:MAG: SDR family oxidoreductase [Acidobacteriia bacterium]|nr:SDR family oxidoreductase [Terriglobia bacterium]
MKIVVIGGTGLIGSKLVNKLREHGHEAIAASPNSGVNSVTGEGLAEVLKGASVAVDVTNSPSWEDAAVLKFFETSTRNLLTYGAAAGVGHHVALSVVGTERLSESGFFRAKIAQEKLIKASSIPYSIVQATQFFEFLKEIGGPEQFRLDELVRRRLALLKDPREVIADPNARYSGAKISEKTLVPGDNARLGETRFETWLTQSAAQIPSAHPQTDAA